MDALFLKWHFRRAFKMAYSNTIESVTLYESKNVGNVRNNRNHQQASWSIHGVCGGKMHEYGHGGKVFSFLCVLVCCFSLIVLAFVLGFVLGFFAKQFKNGNPLILCMCQNKMWCPWVFIFLSLCLLFSLSCFFTLQLTIIELSFTMSGRGHE